MAPKPPAPRDGAQHVRRVALSDVVYEKLRDEIIRGEIEDGAQLSQAHLAERYGVSRIPVREALRRLQSESMVVATPFHPFVVRKVTLEQVIELVDIRASLEDLAMSRRQLPTAVEIAELRKVNRQMARAAADAWLALDRRFHALLCGDSQMSIEFVDDVRDRVQKYTSSVAMGKPGRTIATQEHDEIVDVLEAGDMVTARDMLFDHIMTFRVFITEQFQDSDG